jgi:hypothetical protein
MTPLCSSEVFLVKFYVAPTSASKKVERNLVTSVLDHQLLVPQLHNLDFDQPKVFLIMSGEGRCADKRIGRTVAYLLRCPRSTAPEAMRACRFSDKESKDARKQMAVHRADSNATTNQRRDQQKWAVVVAAIVTATAAATTATRRRDGDARTQQPTNEGIS